MLVLSRRMRDSIMIGHNIVVTVLSIGRDQVRLGIDAPGDVEVHREEVYRAIQQANREAATSNREDLGALAGVLERRRTETIGGSDAAPDAST
ncbi:MAG TPA: carbon storage regulator CsrA [Acidimicrobiales bacterium]|nr:carbon storage regulator CsrA [Acidimicrobiales bacterium]